VISKVHVRKLLQINRLQKAVYGRLTDTREWSARLVRFHAHAAQPWLQHRALRTGDGIQRFRLANYTVTILEGFDPLVGFRRLRLRFRSEPG